MANRHSSHVARFMFTLYMTFQKKYKCQFASIRYIGLMKTHFANDFFANEINVDNLRLFHVKLHFISYFSQ
jgi:hypothetical protein